MQVHESLRGGSGSDCIAVLLTRTVIIGRRFTNSHVARTVVSSEVPAATVAPLCAPYTLVRRITWIHGNIMEWRRG